MGRRTTMNTSTTAAAISVVAAMIPASNAYPTGFLDFLYPQEQRWEPSAAGPSTVVLTEPPRHRRRRRAWPLPRGGQPPSGPLDENDVRTAVPPKYEAIENGWVLAEDWRLHGKRRNEVSSKFLAHRSARVYFWPPVRKRDELRMTCYSLFPVSSIIIIMNVSNVLPHPSRTLPSTSPTRSQTFTWIQSLRT